MRRLAAGCAVLAVIALMVWWLEPRLVFFPLAGEPRTPADEIDRWEPLDVATEDGETLRAWWLEHPEATADVLYFHGNGGNLALWLPVLAGIHAQGLNVLAVDYRGYGVSTGSPTEQGLYADADATRAAYDRRRSGERPVVYWGRSLGGVVAAYLASVRPPDALVLESTFPDKASVLRGRPVLRMLNVFGRYELPTARFLEQVRVPVLVIHGDADSIIPFALGQELHEGVAHAQFVRIPGGDHNDLHGPGEDAYWKPIMAFIAGVTTGGSS